MFDFNDYKREIDSISRIRMQKTLTNTPEQHVIVGKLAYSHGCDFLVRVECNNYKNCAGISVSFGIAKRTFNIFDKEFEKLRRELSDELAKYRTSHNEVFIVGAGLEYNGVNYWGLTFNDLNKTDPINNKSVSCAIACVNSAIDWLFEKNIAYCLNDLVYYFKKQRANV